MKLPFFILIICTFYFISHASATKKTQTSESSNSLLLQNIQSVSQTELADNNQTPKEHIDVPQCKVDLLQSYIFDEGKAFKTPKPLSESQKDYCDNMQTTCCTDDDFMQLFERVEQNVNRVKTLGQMAGQTLQDLANLSMFDIDNIFRDIDPAFYLSNNIQESVLKAFITNLQGNVEMSTNNLIHGIRYLLRHSSGAVCGLCVPENHGFVELGEENESSMLTVDPEQCLAQLQDNNFADYLWTLKDMTTVYHIAKVLNEKYQTEHDFDFSFLNPATFNLLEEQRQWCIVEENFEETPVECLQLCGNLGLYFNNPLSVFADPVTTSYVLFRDYATAKSLLLASNRLHDGSVITIESRVKTSLKIQNVQDIEEDRPDFNDLYNRMFFLSYAESILEPLKNAKYDLETMPQKVNPDCKGWVNYEYGAFVFVVKNGLWTVNVQIVGILSLLAWLF